MNSEQASAISVRQARPEYAEQICHIHVNSVRSLCAKDYTQSQIEAWVGNLTPENYRYAMQEMGEIMFVAMEGNLRYVLPHLLSGLHHYSGTEMKYTSCN